MQDIVICHFVITAEPFTSKGFCLIYIIYQYMLFITDSKSLISEMNMSCIMQKKSLPLYTQIICANNAIYLP